MNDLGFDLAWLALQVACLLAPAAALQLLASRRGPASGAWVATWSLGMAAGLGIATLATWVGLAWEPIGSVDSTAPSVASPTAPATVPPDATARGGASGAAGLTLPGIHWPAAWEGLGRHATGAVPVVREWGRALALVGLGAMAIGLLRVLLGLWAIRLCRRRGIPIDDPAMIGLVEELRTTIGCRRSIEVVEVRDLATPATAGWRRPLLLLPDGWRRWGDSERRAVVAHELAHVVRGDYAAGLLARLAVALNGFHPLSLWMAGRLHLEQELAADAMGARFAGGRASYVRALSRLALEQDGRPSDWPARAFLPARGTLIRRIAMLRNDTDGSRGKRRDGSWLGRVGTAAGLLALAVGLASWKAPARATGDGPSPTPAAPRDEPARPFEVRYLSDSAAGVVAIRPAAIASRAGMESLTSLLRAMLDEDLHYIAEALDVDLSRPGFVELRCEDVESIVLGIDIGGSRDGNKDEDGRPMHQVMTSGLTVRATAPFDWRAFIEQWNLELVEVREPSGAYFKLAGPKETVAMLGDTAFYMPDERTLVLEREDVIKAMIAQEEPTGPEYLRGADWERASLGVLAVAFDNANDAFITRYDLGRPDDEAFLTLFRGIDRWVLDVADADAITFHAEATGRDPQAAEAAALAVERLAQLGRMALNSAAPAEGGHDRAIRLARGLLDRLDVARDGRTVVLSAEGFGTFDDLAALLASEIAEAQVGDRAAAAKPKAERR